MPIKSHVIPPALNPEGFFPVTWGLGIGGTVSTGTKLPPLLPLIENSKPVYISVLCKTWPSSGNLVFDILFRPFGSTTRTTISNGSQFTVTSGSADTVVLTNFASGVILYEFGELSLDVTSAGAAADVTVRLKCKRYTAAIQQAVIPGGYLPPGPPFANSGTLAFSSPQSSFGIALIG